MQAWSRFWQQMVNRAVRQAWGLAQDGDDWVLVGLAPLRSGGVRVQAIQRVLNGATVPEDGDFGEGLAQLDTRSFPAGRRLSVALQAEDMVTGVLELPAHLPSEDWAAEVQTEVSQWLGLRPEEVSFDFQPDPVTEGLLSRVHWVGCDLALIRTLKNSTRSAGWQLHSVEPAWHAAQRAASQLKGGLASLLTQSPLDWQFDWPKLPQTQYGSVVEPGELGPSSELRQAMLSAAGPRLVASGLALKAWL
jgi:hypothetical protein